MKRSHVLIFSVALLGSFAGSIATMYFSHSSFLASQDASLYLAQKAEENKTETPNVQATQTPDIWQSAVSESAQSIVAVQTFQDAQMIRSGSGITVSADGLVLTLADLVPPGQFTYQVAYNDRILRGNVVVRDYSKNLALVKIEGSDFNIANFSTESNIQSGKDLVVVGRVMDVGQPVLFAQKAMVYTSNQKLTVIDTISRPTLGGAQVVDGDKKVIGIVSLRSGKVTLISAAAASEFLTAYLNKVGE